MGIRPSLPTGGGALQDIEQPRAAEHKSAELGFETVPIKILLVDDEPKNLVALATILDDARYQLVQAESADEALLLLLKEEFALILLDIHMPEMSGFELAQLIKQRKKTACLPIIFLTAYYSEDQHILEGYETGAVDYLHKPINPAILRSKVAVFAELFMKTHEIAAANSALVDEIEERRRVQRELLVLNDELERRVEARAADLRQVADELSESDRRKDQFLAMLAHELRNPLAPIRNAVEILRMMPEDVEAVKSATTLMDRQVVQMVRLVDDLLDVSRISRGKIELRMDRIELLSVVAEVVESTQPFASSLQHALTTDLPDAPIYIDADATRLAQLVGNLLHNACKFTPTGGRISLGVARDDQQAVLRVADSGVGIPADQLASIFEMFVQGDTSLERAHSGLGIGLTLVKQLAEMHGGTVEAHSQGKGMGAEFVVRLPIVADAPVFYSDEVSAIDPPSKIFGRILVVDDNRDSAQTLAKLLELDGSTTLCAFDGSEALMVGEKFCPDVVLLDIGLPGINGYDTARMIRDQPWGREVVLIALTGWGKEEDRRRSREAGFNGHLVKPVEFAELTKLLANFFPRNN
jgi:signal transduction histidine kinase